MKKNVRNALAISGLALAIGASGLTLTASANTGERSSRIERQQNVTKNVRSKKTEATEFIKKKTVIGTVTAVSNETISIQKAEKTYTITITPETRILNASWKKITLSDIKEGDKIRVLGSLANTTISARTVRDISLK
jgi:hypothetical protein